MNDKPEKLNRLTAIIILVIIMGIIGVGGYFILKSNQNNANANLFNVNQSINTSEWQTFRNEKIGITFSYPSSYGSPIVEEVSKEKESPGVLAGKGIGISFGENLYAFSFLASSGDYEGFKQDNYHGKEDISKICPKLSVYDEKNKSLCLPINVANQKTLQRFFIFVDEGAVFVASTIYIDLASKEYPFLTISQGYPELSDKLQGFIDTDNEEAFSQKAKIIIENLQQKKDLPTTTAKQVEDFDVMLNSLKLL